MVPSPIVFGVTTAITIANEIAKRAYERERTNSFLDEINSGYFQPQGLYCFFMTYKPGSDSASTPMDISSTIAKYTSPGQGSFKTHLRNQKKSDGTTHGEMQLPLAAPVVYPALDHASEAQKGGWYKSSAGFVTDYMDRRAQATFADENPDSALATRPLFASSLGHPAAMTKDKVREKSRDLTGRRSKERRQGPLSMALGALMGAAGKGDSGGAQGAQGGARKGKGPIGMMKRALKPVCDFLDMVDWGEANVCI